MKNELEEQLLNELIHNFFHEAEKRADLDINIEKGWKDMLRRIEEVPTIGEQAPNDNFFLIGAGRNKNKSKIARNPFQQNDV